MYQNYKRTKINSSKKEGVSRRQMLGLGAIALGTLVAKSAYDVMQIDNYRLDDLLPKDKITVVKKRKNVTSGTSGELIIPTAYVVFRGNIFELYPIKANKNDTGPLSLVQRAHIMYNPGVKLETPILARAVELFNYFNHKNGATLENIVEGEKTLLDFKTLPTSIIKENKSYAVPVITPYESIDEVVTPKVVI